MEELQIFSNAEFGDVRSIIKDGEPWFCLADACRILEIKNSRDAKNRLMQDGVGTTDIIDSLGRNQTADFINEPNLYKLIFQSRKAEAERFANWVTSEVLPSIRKHGLYAKEELLDNPDIAIAAFKALKEEREARKALEAENKQMQPLALFAKSVSASDTSILIGDLAKLLKQNGYDTGQKRLFEELRQRGFLMKSGSSKNLPTQKGMELGLFEVKESTINNPDGSVRVTKTTKVTGKGQVYFVNLFLGKQVEEKVG